MHLEKKSDRKEKGCIAKMLLALIDMVKAKMDTKKNTEGKEDHNKYYYDKLRNLDMKYFQLREFDCNCKDCEGKETGNNMDINFLIRLENARKIAGIPFKITSGVRCEKHNKAIGGVYTSAHKNIPCNASDISVHTSGQRFKILEGLLKAGFVRIGIGKNFIHCDTDKTKSSQRVAWDYY